MQFWSFCQSATNPEEKMVGRKMSASAAVEVKHYSKKVKRYRSAFTTGQISYLEEQFKKCPYIGNATRKEVANVLSISERAIKIWFQNRRMKEKKEVINKDFNLDRHNNSIDMTNDSLNNVHSLQSTNDRHRSLQATISSDVEKNNCINNNLNHSPIHRLDNLKQGSREYEEMCKFNKCDVISNHFNSSHKPVVSLQAANSNQNLNRAYDNKQFMKYLEKNSNEGVNSNKATVPKIDNIWRPKIQLSSNPAYQDLPQDLSARNNSNTIFPQSHQENVNKAYFPFCATQNLFTPCVSAGNVIWKPVNIMPFPSLTSLPLSVTENQQSGIPDILMQKVECNCKCHVKNLTSFHQDKFNSQSQYVIALPFNQSTSQ